MHPWISEVPKIIKKAWHYYEGLKVGSKLKRPKNVLICDASGLHEDLSSDFTNDKLEDVDVSLNFDH